MSDNCEHEPLFLGDGYYFAEVKRQEDDDYTIKIELCNKCHLVYWYKKDDEKVLTGQENGRQ